MSMFASKTHPAATPAGDDQATDLPAGYDDQSSPFWVHPELRPHYRADDDDMRIAYQGEAQQVALQDAAQAELERRQTQYEKMRESKGRHSPVHLADQPTLQKVLSDRDWRVNQEANLQPSRGQVDRAVHSIRWQRAATAATVAAQEQEAEQRWLAFHTCAVCSQASQDVQPGRLADDTAIQAHPWCRVAVDAELLRRAEDRRLDDGRTIAQAAAAWATKAGR